MVKAIGFSYGRSGVNVEPQAVKKWPLQLKQREKMIQLIISRCRIGIFILSLLIAFPAASHALCEVTLQWDTNTPTPEGYLVFGREEGQSYDYDDPWWRIVDPDFVQCTIDQLDESKTYYFVVRAYVNEDVSGDSNEVRFAYTDSSSALDNSSDGGSSSRALGAGCFIQSLFGFEK